MAQATSPLERAGIVFGLCPDSDVYERLASIASERGLTDSTVRAAGTASTLRTIGERTSNNGRELSAWTRDLHRIDHLEERALIDDCGDDPLLEACFTCLAKVPSGGAPWQGSWRGNRLNDVIAALSRGGIILVVEARSIEEQRDWARTLLKSGCAFVQTHDSALAALAST